jgi:hypothetical protein
MTIFWPSTHPSSRSLCRNASSRGGLSEGDVKLRKPIRGTFPACCASAASGAARSTAPVPARNVRRSISRSSRKQSASQARGDAGRGETGSGPCRSPPHGLGGSLAESVPRRRDANLHAALASPTSGHPLRGASARRPAPDGSARGAEPAACSRGARLPFNGFRRSAAASRRRRAGPPPRPGSASSGPRGSRRAEGRGSRSCGCSG